MYLFEKHGHYCDGSVRVYAGRRSYIYRNLAELSQSYDTKISGLAESFILLAEYGNFPAGIWTGL